MTSAEVAAAYPSDWSDCARVVENQYDFYYVDSKQARRDQLMEYVPTSLMIQRINRFFFFCFLCCVIVLCMLLFGLYVRARREPLLFYLLLYLDICYSFYLSYFFRVFVSSLFFPAKLIRCPQT